MNFLKDDAEKLLKTREERARFQNELQEKYQKTLIVIKANYPGTNKNNCDTTFITTKAFLALKKLVRLEKYFVQSTVEGVIYYLVVTEAILTAKHKAISLENKKAWGRLLDIDVYANGQSITRTQLNYGRRSCFLCKEQAVICARSNTHSLQEIKAYFSKSVNELIFFQDRKEMFFNLTIYGLINELNKPYGFGCVGIADRGSHFDMDIYTFLASIDVLSEGFVDIVKINTASFEQLRAFGLQLEDKMFAATKGVNTYKGVIFILSLIYASIINASNYQNITLEIKKLTSNILQDFSQNNISNGLKIYYQHQIEGIRGAAHKGFPLFFNVFQPYFAKEKDIMKLYLMIISKVDDTTIIKRTSLMKLRYIQKKAGELISTPEKWEQFNADCKKANISCGGSADTLAVVLILNLVKDSYPYFKIDKAKSFKI